MEVEYQDDEANELAELKNFVFDSANINVEALESYLNANQEQFIDQEDEIQIDINSMIQKGEDTQSANSTMVSSSSQVSKNAQGTEVKQVASNI